MPVSKATDYSVVWMSGDYVSEDLMLHSAIVDEGISKLTRARVLFMSKSPDIDLDEFLGRTMRLHVQTEGEAERVITGICTSVEHLGFQGTYDFYTAEFRPKLWLLTRTSDCRVFQNKTAAEIIKQVMDEAGLTDYTDSLTGTYETRTYCLQYRESDFNFISRLMEEEGIYYIFRNALDSTSPENMILCDALSAHQDCPERSEYKYLPLKNKERVYEDAIAEWAVSGEMRRGKVTLTDFDFEAPSADTTVVQQIQSGGNPHNSSEVYDYPGRYRNESALGNARAQVRMEADAARYAQMRGTGMIRTLCAGGKMSFALRDGTEYSPKVESYVGDYIVTEATHYFMEEFSFQGGGKGGGGNAQTASRSGRDSKEGDEPKVLMPQNWDFPDEIKEMPFPVFTRFGAIPEAMQYRAPLTTPWPKITGLQTATVVGQDGEEIWTDEHGRIKIQFHWDREGEDNENSSCWVRVVTPWSGKEWGFVAVPRMGQEVVIQFEEGDPDRPICTGMLYNADTMPPYTYPQDATQLGIKTQSSKDAEGYHELMFDDKAGEELMRVQAQKDHQVLVKNKSVVTVGLDEVDAGEHDEDGSVSRVVRNHVTETIQEGDHYFTISAGNQEIDIATDRTQTIGGKHTKTVTGNDETTVEQGDLTIDVSAGSIAIEAAREIKLTVGGSSITIDQSGVTIEAPMVTIGADGMAEMSGTTTTVKGDTMLTLKGGVTKIN